MKGINKHGNLRFSGALPENINDAYWSQDKIRDIRYLKELPAYLLAKLQPQMPILMSGGVVTQGIGTQINITAGWGLVKKTTTIIDNWDSLPPPTTIVEAFQFVEWPQILAFDVTGFSTNGVTYYVFMRYLETDLNERYAARGSGNYFYETEDDYELIITTDSVIDDDHLRLGSYKFDAGVMEITPDFYYPFSGEKIREIEVTDDITAIPGVKYYVNATKTINITLPIPANWLKGARIEVIDGRGYGFRIKRNFILDGDIILPPSTRITTSDNVNIISDDLYSEVIIDSGYGEESTQYRLITSSGLSPILDAGYYMGGSNISGYTDSINKVNLFLKTIKSILTMLETPTAKMAGNQSNLAGYIGGGITDIVLLNKIYKFLFNDQTFFLLGVTLANNKFLLSGAWSNEKGYWLGGAGTVPTKYNTIEAILFINDTQSVLSATLSVAKNEMGSGQSLFAAYVFGGTNTSPSAVNTIEKLLYSTEIRSTLSATLAMVMARMTVASFELANYIFGGLFSGTASDNIQKLLFSTEIRTTIGSVLAVGKYDLFSFSSIDVGYLGGGVNTSSVLQSSVEEFAVVSETIQISSIVLSTSLKNAIGLYGQG